MTWKAAAANLPLGGGKAVMIADPHTGKTEDRLVAMAEVVEMLGGSYVTAEDVGISADDLRTLRKNTVHVTGLPEEDGGSGDPSPYTALGVVESIKTCLAKAFGNDSLEGRTFAVQGLGHVGAPLVGLLLEGGATVVGADVHADTAEAVARAHSIRLVSPEEILFVPCDGVAPCALGAVLNADSIPKLKCRFVAGAANNQLAEEADARRLAERGILYAPDFVVNAGGLINISVELEPQGYRREEGIRRVKAIRQTLDEIFTRATAEGSTPSEAALNQARERIGRVRKANHVT
jgi:leucine dehydrogenase